MDKENWTENLFVELSVESTTAEVPRLDELQVAIDEPKVEGNVSLETSLQQLEEIVKTLEQKDLPLEIALNLFKEGIGLVQYCSGVLNQAEKQMEILLESPDGRLQAKPVSMEMEG